MTLIYNGLLLMVVGMGTVFLFLSIMVFCIGASSKISARFAHLIPEKEPPKRSKAKAKAKPAAPENAVLVAVMAAAVQRYRSESR